MGQNAPGVSGTLKTFTRCTHDYRFGIFVHCDTHPVNGIDYQDIGFGLFLETTYLAPYVASGYMCYSMFLYLWKLTNYAVLQSMAASLYRYGSRWTLGTIFKEIPFVCICM